MEIDGDALAGNLGVIRRLAGPAAAILPVVKADAYGHGMLPVARILANAGADGLAVATLDEAVALRDQGLTGPILVLYPIPPDSVAEATSRQISVVAGEPSGVEALLAAAIRVGVAGDLEIELEVETGLGRGGAAPDAVVDVARRIGAAGARLSGVWSHLQEAEVAEITEAQVARYEEALGLLRTARVTVPRRHLAASAAILLGTVPRYEAVRPGLMTYGLIPDELAGAGIGLEDLPAAARDLRPVLSLHARPLRVVDLPPGHGVSYGPTWRAQRPSRIATLPLGYGDGWPRSLSNRAEALARGVRVPLVGNVAMDAVMADVTDVPGRPVTVDDEFVLLGRQGDEEISAAELARSRTTNSWEVVTTMSGRLTRVYHHAPAGLAGFRSLVSSEDRWLGSNSGMETSATSRLTQS
ncbi:MAG TPA: alanine racemase [Candidatus Bathyarchaeia archaeon]|nr:alanine racemase [Candidatus Bathyarchaeia archaeon]